MHRNSLCSPLYNKQLRTNDCHIGNKTYCGESKNQEWIYDKEKKKIYSKLDPNRCIHLYDLDYLFVQAHPCKDIINQKWEYDEINHTFKSMGKCLSIYMNEEAKEVWVGKLFDGSFAVLLLNKGTFTNDIIINWEEIGFNNIEAKLRDLWERKDLGVFKNGYMTSLKSHTSQLLKVTPIVDSLTKENKRKNNNLHFLIICLLIITITLLLIFFIFFIIIPKKKKGSNNSDDEVNKINGSPNNKKEDNDN